MASNPNGPGDKLGLVRFMGAGLMATGVQFIVVGIVMWLFGTGRIRARTTEEGSRAFVERYGRFLRIAGWGQVILGFVWIAFPPT